MSTTGNHKFVISFPMPTISERINEVFQASGLTQDAFGQKIGVSKAAVCKWTTGVVKNLRNNHLFAIEDNFGYSARWIATGKGPKKALSTYETASGSQVEINPTATIIPDEQKRALDLLWQDLTKRDKEQLIHQATQRAEQNRDAIAELARPQSNRRRG